MKEILHINYTCKMLPVHEKKSKCVDTKFWARGKFSEKWLARGMSETASDTEKPVILKGALEAWAVQWLLFIQDFWEFQVKAAIWKRCIWNFRLQLAKLHEGVGLGHTNV